LLVRCVKWYRLAGKPIGFERQITTAKRGSHCTLLVQGRLISEEEHLYMCAPDEAYEMIHCPIDTKTGVRTCVFMPRCYPEFLKGFGVFAEMSWGFNPKGHSGPSYGRHDMLVTRVFHTRGTSLHPSRKIWLI
jgi:hypothetical protein